MGPHEAGQRGRSGSCKCRPHRAARCQTPPPAPPRNNNVRQDCCSGWRALGRGTGAAAAERSGHPLRFGAGLAPARCAGGPVCGLGRRLANLPTALVPAPAARQGAAAASALPNSPFLALAIPCQESCRILLPASSFFLTVTDFGVVGGGLGAAGSGVFFQSILSG